MRISGHRRRPTHSVLQLINNSTYYYHNHDRHFRIYHDTTTSITTLYDDRHDIVTYLYGHFDDMGRQHGEHHEVISLVHQQCSFYIRTYDHGVLRSTSHIDINEYINTRNEINPLFARFYPNDDLSTVMYLHDFEMNSTTGRDIDIRQVRHRLHPLQISFMISNLNGFNTFRMSLNANTIMSTYDHTIHEIIQFFPEEVAGTRTYVWCVELISFDGNVYSARMMYLSHVHIIDRIYDAFVAGL